MPVKPLELDDRTFTDLFNEVRSLIPRHAPGWTNHNVSDPGIMLVELFAWLTEAMLYRINRVSDTSRMRLLELLGAAFRPAQPALVSVRLRCSDGPPDYDGAPAPLREPFQLKAGAPVWGRPRGGAGGGVVQRVPFEVTRAVEFTPADPVRVVILRQTQPIQQVSLLRSNAGRLFELVPVSEGPANVGVQSVGGPARYFVPPPEPRPRSPRVTIASIAGDSSDWRLVPSLSGAPSAGRRCVYKPWLNAIAFGSGGDSGDAPPAGAEIRVTYRSAANRGAGDPPASVTDTFRGTGKPWQICRLSRPLLGLDLQDPDELEPLLEVRESGGADWRPWQYVTRFLELAPGALLYTYEPWFNALRFGGPDDAGHTRYGAALPPKADLRLTGHLTMGAAGNLPRDSEFGGWLSAKEASQRQLRLATEDKGNAWELFTPGANPTVLDEARLQVLDMLRPDFRAVTAGDFAAVLRTADPNVVRVVCLPSQAPVDAEHAGLGDVGLIMIPDRAAELTAGADDLDCILASAPASRRLLASTRDGRLGLWAFAAGEATDTHQVIKELPPGQALAGSFSPDGRRVLTEDAYAPTLRDARTLEALSSAAVPDIAALNAPVDAPAGAAGSRSALQLARFSPTGRWWMSLQAFGVGRGAHLRDIDDGATLLRLPRVERWEQLAFAPTGADSRLAAPGETGATLDLWDLDCNALLRSLELPAPAEVGAVVYSADGTTLAASVAGNVRTWHIVPGRPLRPVDVHLPSADDRAALLLSPDGARLATLDEAGRAALWSSRTGKLLADLAADSAVVLFGLSASGRWLATAHADMIVRLWNAVTGAQVDRVRPTGRVSALVFGAVEGTAPPAAHTRPRLVVITAPGPAAVQAWDLDPATNRLAPRPAIPSTIMPVVHTSGRWLAYTDARLVHVWDVAQAADLAALYADFDDPGVIPDGWELEAADDLSSAPLGLQAATGPLVRPTAGRFLRIASASSAEPGARRTVQLWDAEFVYTAAARLEERRLVTSQTRAVGPAYDEVKVEVVVRAMPATNQNRLEQDVRKALAHFFDPLHGGPDGIGWPLGRPVYNSEICQVVEAVAGVDFVDSVSYLNKVVDDKCGDNCRGIPPYSLVKADLVVCIEIRDDHA